MAKATPIIEKVPVTTFEEKVNKINLELSLDEAKTLYLLTGICMGSSNSPRKETDEIYKQLSVYFSTHLRITEFFQNYHPIAWKDNISTQPLRKLSHHLDNIHSHRPCGVNCQ